MQLFFLSEIYIYLRYFGNFSLYTVKPMSLYNSKGVFDGLIFREGGRGYTRRNNKISNFNLAFSTFLVMLNYFKS